VWRKPITPTTAKELRKMMIQTVADGTARKGFRGRERDKILRLLEVGGKTGSLTGKNPRGKHEWFIGYAQSPNRRVAIGMVIVSETKWKVRPSELAKEIFHYYFSPRLVMEANAQPPLYGP
ncbi:MAG TPA: penicillin-binding transpeptidase domain-containing protein, partial [Bdellovibrionota bacterium]|nr:penicillin-binding transpeptidase domain-containing protein [Bdellovibrionota bacterium]